MQQCRCGKVSPSRKTHDAHALSALCPFRKHRRDSEVHFFGPGVGYLCRTERDPVQRKITHVWYPQLKPGAKMAHEFDDDERRTVRWGTDVLELAAKNQLTTFDATALRAGDVLFGVSEERYARSVYGVVMGADGMPSQLDRTFEPYLDESPSVPIFSAELLPRDATGLLRYGDVLLDAIVAACADLVCPVLEVADDHPLLRRLALEPDPGHTWYLSPGCHVMNPAFFYRDTSRDKASLLLLIKHSDSMFVRVCNTAGEDVPFDQPSKWGLDFDFADSKFM